ncbi:MAG: ABC1 kinase family protein [Alphaproteobacteria bacterium]
MADKRDTREDKARIGRQLLRAGRVGANMAGVGARAAGSRLGLNIDQATQAAALKAALGGLKGPLMKLAQIVSTVPDLLPEEFAQELSELQNNAPSMGWAFVRRRMKAELGPDWQSKFQIFENEAAAAASLGQVHKAQLPDGTVVAAKLQYPDMMSAVEADLKQLAVVLGLHRRMDTSIDTRQIEQELADRLREELDYEREAKHMALYHAIFSDTPNIQIPKSYDAFSTRRLLTMDWLDGKPLLDFADAPLETRNAIAKAMFEAWWLPFVRYGVIHGDPHLGNYTITDDLHLNLMDYGCIRIFRPEFVVGVIELYHALSTNDLGRARAAYQRWGFQGLTDEMVETLNLWAGFIYGPMLDNRTRTIADGIDYSQYGRSEMEQTRKQLRALGTLTIPKEFVFMDRAAIGLGSVFLRLKAELNWHDLFTTALGDAGVDVIEQRQSQLLQDIGLDHTG